MLALLAKINLDTSHEENIAVGGDRPETNYDSEMVQERLVRVSCGSFSYS